MASPKAQPSTAGQPVHRPAKTGPTFWGPGDAYTFLATGKETNGAYFQLEAVVGPGGGPPPHVHHGEDETFYLIEGNLEMRLGNALLSVKAGDYVSVPRGTVHGYRNTGSGPAAMIVTFVPAGFERFFEEVFDPASDPAAPPPPPSQEVIDRIIQAAPKYGYEILLG